MRRRAPRAGRHPSGGRALLLLLLLIAAGLWLDRATAPALLAYAEQRAHALAVAAVEQAVREELGDGPRYDELVVIHRDGQGRVTLLQVDTIRVTRLVAALQARVQARLLELERLPVGVPLGVLTGSDLLAAHGPRIRAAVLPVGTASISLQQRLEGAGINQVRLAIYGLVEARVRVVVPLHRRDVVVRTDFPIADTIIVGEVPESWFQLPQPLWPSR